MESLKLDGSPELPHGRTLSVRRGVADGLEDGTSRESLIPDGHETAYGQGRELGQEWRLCINGEVSRGTVEEIEWDRVRQTSPPIPEGAGPEYRLGRIFGKGLVLLVARAETPSL